MKKLILSFTLSLALLLPMVAVMNPAFAQEEGVEYATEEVVVILEETPDNGFVVPDVPWGLDPNAYYLNWGIFLATILAITQLFKTVSGWEGRKAFILTVIVTLLVTAVGYFFKLGALADAEWWVPIQWFIGAILGGKVGYDAIHRIFIILSDVKKK